MLGCNELPKQVISRVGSLFTYCEYVQTNAPRCEELSPPKLNYKFITYMILAGNQRMGTRTYNLSTWQTNGVWRQIFLLNYVPILHAHHRDRH